MVLFEIIGIVTSVIILVKVLIKVFRHFFPKPPIKYTERTCPKDHDTMCRYGVKRCDTCGTILNDY
jgi:hypothetical protein